MMFNLLGCKHVKDESHIGKYTLMGNSKHVVKNDSVATKRRHELFYMTKSKRINDEMTTKQIVLYVNPMLQPFELSIKSYRGKPYNISWTI